MLPSTRTWLHKCKKLSLIFSFVLCVHAWGQDLRQEVGAEPFLEIFSLEGFSPTLVSCDFTEKGRLKCLVDREVDEVLCEESFQKKVTKITLKKNLFVCDVTHDSAFLSQSWDIEIKEKTRGLQSKWRVRLSSQEQMKNAYSFELKSKKLISRPWVKDLLLATLGSLYLGESSIYSLSTLEVGAGPNAQASLDVAVPVNSSHKKLGYQLGYKRNLINSSVDSPVSPTDFGLWMGLGREWRSRSMGPLDPVVAGWFLSLRAQKALMISGRELRLWAGFVPFWYSVDVFRQAYRAELGTRVTIWQNWGLQALVGWESEIWTHQGYQNNHSQLTAGLGLSVSFGS